MPKSSRDLRKKVKAPICSHKLFVFMASGTIAILSVVNGLSSIAGTVGNLLVCLVIYRNEELQTGVNYFILSLSAADLTVCSIAEPTYVYYLNQKWNGQNFETFKLIAYITLHSSFLNLLSLTVNRLFALWFPFGYVIVMRGRNIAVIVSVIWLVSVVMAIAFSLSPVLKRPAPYFHVAMLLTFAFTYMKIFCIARKQRRRIALQVRSVSHNYRVAKISQDQLTTRTLAILIGVSVILFLPDTWFQLARSSDYTRFHWSFTTMFLSSFLNPCIYVWRSEKFRLALYKTIGVSRRGRRSTVKVNFNAFEQVNINNNLGEISERKNKDNKTPSINMEAP